MTKEEQIGNIVAIYSDPVEVVAHILRIEIRERNLRQVAKKVLIDEGTLSKIAHGRQPSYGVLIEVLRFYGLRLTTQKKEATDVCTSARLEV